MRVVDAATIERVLDYPGLVAALADAFRGRVVAPPRHHHTLPRADGDATLLLMPAWEDSGGAAGVKIVSVFPGNAARGLATVLGSYLLLDGATGAPKAVLDGRVLTLWRTAAASALAATHLARADARRLVMVGAGALAPRLVAAHASVRPIDTVAIWNRTPARAESLAREIARPGLAVTVAGDLATAVAGADIVSVATMSPEPLVRGEWLRPGVHLDLVGAYTPAMREADDAAVRRARVFIDTPAALREAGDIVQPVAAGVIAEADLAGDLAGLCRGTVPGRESAGEITLFKSVGAAIEDLAAAVLVARRLDP